VSISGNVGGGGRLSNSMSMICGRPLAVHPPRGHGLIAAFVLGAWLQALAKIEARVYLGSNRPSRCQLWRFPTRCARVGSLSVRLPWVYPECASKHWNLILNVSIGA
jgi:hypothetical protein